MARRKYALLAMLAFSVPLGCEDKEKAALLAQKEAEDRRLLDELKAKEAAKEQLQSSPGRFVLGDKLETQDRGIINTYTLATRGQFRNTSQFDVADPEGSITYLREDGSEMARVPFSARGEVRAGEVSTLQLTSTEISGAGKKYRMQVERVHVR